MPKPFKVLLIGAVILIPLGGVAAVQHNPLFEVFYMVILVGWYVGFLVWTVLFDAKKRWPHLNQRRSRLRAVIGFNARRHDAIAREHRTEGSGV